MNTELPAVIAAFFAAHNTGHTENFGELFTADAIVSDEDHQYTGGAIKQWIDEAIATYKPIAEVTHFTREGDRASATTQVSGTFPGSPAQIRYTFTFAGDKIAGLVIGA